MRLKPPFSNLSPPPSPVTFADIAAAANRLDGHARRTPVLTSRTVDALTGNTVFFKCENFQRTGAFKFRGSYNALAQLDEETQKRGVIAYSSGNHAQGMALAGQLLDIPTTIIMPQDAPAVKIAATQGYGAEVVLYDRAETTREALGQRMSEAQNRPIIPPYDHPQVIAGQGTAAKELFEEVGALDYLFVCCGGGGLLSGSAISAETLAPDCTVVGVEPKAGDDATRSFYAGTLHRVENPDTIADGARTPYLGQWTFPLVLTHAEAMLTVSDDALLRTMFFLWERLKIVVEPTGALAATAVLQNPWGLKNARIGVLISGGNVDLRQLSTFHALATHA